MKITMKSSITGVVHTKDLPITVEELERYAEGKEFVQDIWPDLPADDREFLKTGITGEEWEERFAGDDGQEF